MKIMLNLDEYDVLRITELNHHKLWVSLSSATPGRGHMVLLTDRGGNMWTACLTESGEWMSQVPGEAPFPPTHWMQLPEAPEG